MAVVDPKPGDKFAKDGRVREVVAVVNRVITYSFTFGWKKYSVHWWTWHKWQEGAKKLNG